VRKDNMKGLCGKCNKRDTCKALCKKAEEYANQDQVHTEEGLINIRLENYDRYDVFGHDTWITPNFNNSSILKRTIILLYLDGKSTRKIAELVPCNRQNVNRIILNFYKEKKIKRENIKDKIVDMLNKNYTLQEIKNEINCDLSYIYKVRRKHNSG
jgi:transposase-like protein